MEAIVRGNLQMYWNIEYEQMLSEKSSLHEFESCEISSQSFLYNLPETKEFIWKRKKKIRGHIRY